MRFASLATSCRNSAAMRCCVVFAIVVSSLFVVAVGAKIAGMIARRFPQRVITLTVVGTPPPVYDNAARVPRRW
ncbi:MAG: hypothetical protein FJX35_28500 [Alphaproteobacteria bacterium]|nr:hypothetical protein [Alphaproteobacteria bacterium]